MKSKDKSLKLMEHVVYMFDCCLCLHHQLYRSSMRLIIVNSSTTDNIVITCNFVPHFNIIFYRNFLSVTLLKVLLVLSVAVKLTT